MTDDITRLVRFTSKGLDEVLQAKLSLIHI